MISLDDSNLVQSSDFGRKASVNAEDFTVDQRSESEVVKNLAAVLPCVGVSVFLLYLIVETIYLGDLSALVIAAQQGDLVGISGFK